MPLQSGRGDRRAASLLPREHGVYAEVGFPLFTALALGEVSWAAILLAAAVVAAFLLHEPVLVLLGRRGARARSDLGARAKTRTVILAVVALGCTVGGVWLAGFAIQLSLLALLIISGLLGLLVTTGQEKTLLGECSIALVLSGTLVPVGFAAGVPVAVASAAAAVWATVFLLGTVTVHAILARGRGQTTRLTAAVSAGVLLLALGAAVTVIVGGQRPALALVPTALVSCVAIATGTTPKRLRYVGWALVLASVTTAVLLVVPVL